MGKKIEVVEMCVSDIKTGFGNPRKIGKKKREELQRSLEMFGNFGIFVIDENNNIIAGNQRLSIIKDENPEAVVTCKKLIGYTEAELRAINIKDNTHSGEWDMDMLADWTADITIDLGLDLQEKNPNERKIKEIEPIRYEKYDYVMIVCRTEVDYKILQRNLGLDNAKVLMAKKRRIQGRAIWYDDIKAQIVPKEDVKENEE